jgi:hypothetical protein
MADFVVRGKHVWEDRFRSPTWAELAAVFPRAQASLIEQARERLLSVPLVRERLAWHGIPWRWSLSYTTETDGPSPVAFLIPQPGKPRLAVPLPAELISVVPLRKLSKPVREAIVYAPQVAGVRWANWELTGQGVLDEVLALVEQKMTVADDAA